MHLVWHRTELRTHDHPALTAALDLARSDNSGLLPLVIIDPKIFNRADLTPRRQAWFLENVRALRESYRKFGSELIVREGEPAKVLDELASELKNTRHAIKTAHFIRNYTPYAKTRDAAATKALRKHGVDVMDYGGQYTHEPGEILSLNETRYTVHAPYIKRWREAEKPIILPRPKKIPAPPSSLRIGEIPKVDSDIPLPKPGEEDAKRRLDWFLKNGEHEYQKVRQNPGLEDRTSKLSYYFNIGVLSPRLAYSKATTYKWKFELSWWDFFADIMDNNPKSADTEAVSSWHGFPWRGDSKTAQEEFERWKTGQTGFPLIDAGMRELNATGFMHNRVRMATADFLTRHLMIDWRLGEEYFRGQLLCGDRAQNVGNWQWVAGCGLSAKPYFRVGNPVSVSKSADIKGEYIKRWIPELAHLPSAVIHEPWLFSPAPENYEMPMVNLKETRVRYLEKAKEHLAKSKSN